MGGGDFDADFDVASDQSDGNDDGWGKIARLGKPQSKGQGQTDPFPNFVPLIFVGLVLLFILIKILTQ